MAGNEIVYSEPQLPDSNKQKMVVDNLLPLLQEYYPEVTRNLLCQVGNAKFALNEPITILHDIPLESGSKVRGKLPNYLGVHVVEPCAAVLKAVCRHVLGYIHSIDQSELQNTAGGEYKVTV